MKNLVLILVMGVMISCAKDDQPLPKIIPSTVCTTCIRVLDVKIDTLGIDYTDLVAYDKKELLGPNNASIGNTYYYSKDNFKCTICYETNIGITSFTGSIGTHGFLVNLNKSTINICGGPQNSQIIYNLKYSGRIVYEDTFYKRKALLLLRDLKMEIA